MTIPACACTVNTASNSASKMSAYLFILLSPDEKYASLRNAPCYAVAHGQEEENAPATAQRYL
jgi:hypothetical protein